MRAISFVLYPSPLAPRVNYNTCHSFRLALENCKSILHFMFLCLYYIYQKTGPKAQKWYQNWFEEIEPIISVWNIPTGKPELKRSIFHRNDTKKSCSLYVPARISGNFLKMVNQSHNYQLNNYSRDKKYVRLLSTFFCFSTFHGDIGLQAFKLC